MRTAVLISLSHAISAPTAAPAPLSSSLLLTAPSLVLPRAVGTRRGRG